MKSDEVLGVVKEARKVIQSIIDNKDEGARIRQALVFVLMFQSLSQLIQELVSCETDEERAQGMALLDDAIARLEDDNDLIAAFKYDPSFNPNNKGDA